MYFFEIVGSGFIWHQIRCIASVLFAVGDGLEDVSVVQELLDVKRYPGRPQYVIAAPEPLVFWCAEYEGVEWQEADGALDVKIRGQFAKMLEELEIRCSVLRCFSFGFERSEKVRNYTKIENLQMTKSVEELLEEYRIEKGESILGDDDE
jgi:tRNA pseudouridine38/39 synthase